MNESMEDRERGLDLPWASASKPPGKLSSLLVRRKIHALHGKVWLIEIEVHAPAMKMKSCQGLCCVFSLLALLRAAEPFTTHSAMMNKNIPTRAAYCGAPNVNKVKTALQTKQKNPTNKTRHNQCKLALPNDKSSHTYQSTNT